MRLKCQSSRLWQFKISLKYDGLWQEINFNIHFLMNLNINRKGFVKSYLPITCIINDPKTITQPQPPSGGGGEESSSSSPILFSRSAWAVIIFTTLTTWCVFSRVRKRAHSRNTQTDCDWPTTADAFYLGRFRNSWFTPPRLETCVIWKN